MVTEQTNIETCERSNWKVPDLKRRMTTHPLTGDKVRTRVSKSKARRELKLKH